MRFLNTNALEKLIFKRRILFLRTGAGDDVTSSQGGGDIAGIDYSSDSGGNGCRIRSFSRHGHPLVDVGRFFARRKGEADILASTCTDCVLTGLCNAHSMLLALWPALSGA